MITFEKAFDLTMSATRLLPEEAVDIRDAMGRVLSRNLVSDMEMPPFNKSAMDGYACRKEDLGNELTVQEMIPAGACPKKIIGENQCSKIMTGAAVPEGADCVIMVEYTEKSDCDKIRFLGRNTSDNICIKGEDVKSGDVVIKKGTLLKPQHIAVMASIGCVAPKVFRRVRIGVIATGDELVEPSEHPEKFKIRNSNASQLLAQIQNTGAKGTYYGIALDNKNNLTDLISQATRENDLILLSGGVSEGDFDLVPKVLSEQGFQLLFEKIAIKPGKPTVFGFSENCFCFGLPGNPVSTFVLFEILVKPFVFKLMGYEYPSLEVSMRLGETIQRKKIARASWIPVVMRNKNSIVPIEYHGSAHNNALCVADGMICIPVGVSKLHKGSFVNVRFI